MRLLAAPPDDVYDFPVNLDAERFVLGACLTDESALLQVGGVLTEDDFSIEKHKTIFRRICDLHEQGSKVDRVTLFNELTKHGESQSVDGLSYLVSLDDGLPQIYNLDSYVGIVKEKSTLRKLYLVSSSIAKRAASGREDAHALLGSIENALLGLSDARIRREPATLATILDEYEGGYEAFIDQGRKPKGIQTGFLKLDEMTGGFRSGELIILAARPALGKTAMALNIAHQAAVNNKPVAVFSLEMGREVLFQRIACSQARIDQQKHRAGYLSHVEKLAMRDTLSNLYDLPLFLDDNSGANLMDLHSSLRRLIAQHGISLAVLDYLQLLSGARGANRTEQISAISRGLKLMAVDLGIPFLVLSQLSRGPETRAGDHRPMLSDLRESGSIEQDADMVMFIFREEIYKPEKESLKGIAELILAKQRNGPTGTVKLAWLNKYTRFENLATDYDSGSPFEGEYAA